MTKPKELPSQQYLNECFTYDPETGLLYWKERPAHHFRTKRGQLQFNSRFSHSEVGHTHKNSGYRFTTLDYRGVKVHRIIWKLIHGNDPETIDHINGNRRDNRLENLRSVTNNENQKNKKKRVDNKSGISGVSWDRQSSKWVVRIKINNISKNLGRFVSIEEAVKVRKEAEIKYGYHENNGREY